ncbi:MAG: response regulator [Planctomycetota bacterium]
MISAKKTHTGKRTILIIEDEPVALKMLESLLINEGYNCMPAGTGDKAIEIIKKEDVDLFLTDIMIPKRHGIAIAWEIRTRGFEMPIVVLSAFLDQWDKEVFKDCRIDRWISKPAKPKVLFQVIRELLEKNQAPKKTGD